eukprot:5940178-Amphidinium_carterae.1
MNWVASKCAGVLRESLRLPRQCYFGWCSSCAGKSSLCLKDINHTVSKECRKFVKSSGYE